MYVLWLKKMSFGTLLTHTGHTWLHTGTPGSCLVVSWRELTFLFFGRFQKFQRQIMCLINLEYFLPIVTKALTGPPGRRLEVELTF